MESIVNLIALAACCPCVIRIPKKCEAYFVGHVPRSVLVCPECVLENPYLILFKQTTQTEDTWHSDLESEEFWEQEFLCSLVHIPKLKTIWNAIVFILNFSPWHSAEQILSQEVGANQSNEHTNRTLVIFRVSGNKRWRYWDFRGPIEAGTTKNCVILPHYLLFWDTYDPVWIMLYISRLRQYVCLFDSSPKLAWNILGSKRWGD